MPWKEVTPMEQRSSFVHDYKSALYTMTELCERYGISRKTGYKWTSRYKKEGLHGLEDRSKTAHVLPHKTPQWIEERLVKVRQSHPLWGPKKIVAWLARRVPEIPWPAPSTAGEILKRHGLVKERRKRRRCWHPGKPFVEMTSPNDVWAADFKGEFRMGCGEYCYPLTVTDGMSRYLLACQGRSSVSATGARSVFERLFKEYGLPKQILTDNGQPFSSPGVGGLSRLSIWWVRLGIQPVRIERGHPEQNGRHERMHRTLKAATARPPAATMESQQRAFDRFLLEYNEERPHESLGQATPAGFYRPSGDEYPSCLPRLEYPGHYEVRRAGPSGCIHWKGRRPFIGKVFKGQYLGLEEIDDRIWSVYFGPILLCRFDEQQGQIARG